jgi:hypothetical protein
LVPGTKVLLGGLSASWLQIANRPVVGNPLSFVLADRDWIDLHL